VTGYQPRWIAFARSLGTTPEALDAVAPAERVRRNADFMAWVRSRLAECRAASPHLFSTGGSIADHDGVNAWLLESAA
jgi:hypothetical protein